MMETEHRLVAASAGPDCVWATCCCGLSFKSFDRETTTSLAMDEHLRFPDKREVVP